MMKGNSGFNKIAWWLLIIGGLNWGLVGLGGFFGGNWDVVDLLLGSWPWAAYVVYVLVGVSAVVSIFGGCCCGRCKVGSGGGNMGGGNANGMQM